MGKKKKAKERKGKKPVSKSKHNDVKIWEKYKDGKVTKKFCPRCGPGYILGEHKGRVTCGKCQYSEIKIKK